MKVFNRKRLSFALVFILSLVLLQVGGFAHPSEPDYGGSLKVALPAEPPGLDPTTNAAAVINRIVYNNVYQGLVRINREGELVPSLAKEWEVSDGGATYTFQLREDVKFHNGEKLTAEDVVFTLNRARGQAVTVPHPEYFAPIENISTSSRFEVKIELSEPSSIFLFNLARGDSIILPKGAEDLSTHPIGTGPFRFVDWKRGDSVTLARFEDYYREELPYLDEVIFRFIEDTATRIASLQGGDIDAIAYLSSPENALTLQEDPNLKVLEGVTTWQVILAMNNEDERFSDPRVRKAINYGIDQQEVIEGATFGLAEPIGSHMSTTNPNYIDLSWLYPYDPEKAQDLLKEAGFPNGFEAKLVLPSPYELSVRSGTIVADQLKRIGIQLEIEQIGWAQWLQRVFTNADYDMTVIGHAEAFDISIYANPDYYFRYENERFQEIIRRAERETDREKRAKLYSIAQWIIGEDVPVSFLFLAPSLPAMRNEVQNWWVNYPLPVVDLTEVWID